MLTLEMPYSEVCMHMHIAGTTMQVEPLPNGMAQLYRDGRKFSFPITQGEAGVPRCATIGCTEPASQLIEWGAADERVQESVCSEDAAGYLRRPVLKAVSIDA